MTAALKKIAAHAGITSTYAMAALSRGILPRGTLHSVSSKEKWPFDNRYKIFVDNLSEVLGQLDSENIDAYSLVEWNEEQS